LDYCLAEFASIPKTGYHFHLPADVYPQTFVEDTQRIFENLTPVCVVFAYQGNINESWIDHLSQWIWSNKPGLAQTPAFIVVNNKGMIFREVKKVGDKKLSFSYRYIDFAVTKHPGEAFSRMLFELFNLAKEDQYMTPDYSYYFNADQDSIDLERSKENK
jgi:hypothetical protein